MQSPWSNLHFCSSGVSFPSFPSLSKYLGVLPNLLLFRLDDEGVDWESLKEDFLSDLPDDARLVLPLEDFVWQAISSLHSQ